MRVLVVFVVLLSFVTIVQAEEMATPKLEAREEGPAFVVDLRVSLPAGDATSGNAFSLAEDLQGVANLGDFELRLRMRDAESPSADLAATFTFDSLAELLDWYQSDALRSLLDSMEEASGKSVKMVLRGTLSGEQ
ncbi:MAG: DUF2059 domain-containing protein [Candidatus Eisenbacteria bacterium]|nr:DUF2059 domain-containing protein [Candidatus Eisenbacteria bacterium]